MSTPVGCAAAPRSTPVPWPSPTTTASCGSTSPTAPSPRSCPAACWPPTRGPGWSCCAIDGRLAYYHRGRIDLPGRAAGDRGRGAAVGRGAGRWGGRAPGPPGRAHPPAAAPRGRRPAHRGRRARRDHRQRRRVVGDRPALPLQLAGVPGRDRDRRQGMAPRGSTTGAERVPAHLEWFPCRTGDVEAVVYGDWRTADKVVLALHGGPDTAWDMGWQPTLEWLAATGCAVVAPNQRGSTGYGAAHADAIRATGACPTASTSAASGGLLHRGRVRRCAGADPVRRELRRLPGAPGRGAPARPVVGVRGGRTVPFGRRAARGGIADDARGGRPARWPRRGRRARGGAPHPRPAARRTRRPGPDRAGEPVPRAAAPPAQARPRAAGVPGGRRCGPRPARQPRPTPTPPSPASWPPDAETTGHRHEARRPTRRREMRDSPS